MIDLDTMHLVALVLSQVASSAAMWGALRADVRNLIREVGDARASAEKAHGRIDKMLTRQAQG